MRTKRGARTEILNKTHSDTTILINGRTPFISAVKRITKTLEKFDRQTGPALHHSKYQNGEYKKVKFILVKGMGKCIQQTISLALHFQTKQNYVVDIYTGTVPVVDTVETEEVIETREGQEVQTRPQLRKVSYVEVKIWLKLR